MRELANRIKLKSDTQQRLEDQLLYKENRMYLWLYLAMDDIEDTLRKSLFPDNESIQLMLDSVNAAFKKILS